MDTHNPAMPAGLLRSTGAEQRVAVVDGFTACRLSNHRFADAVADQIAVCIPEFRCAQLMMSGYTPPTVGKPAEGFLDLCFFRSVDQAVSFGILFGAEAEVDGFVHRRYLDRQQWLADPRNPLASGIVAANFDEAWRIACAAAAALDIRRIEIAYGC